MGVLASNSTGTLGMEGAVRRTLNSAGGGRGHRPVREREGAENHVPTPGGITRRESWSWLRARGRLRTGLPTPGGSTDLGPRAETRTGGRWLRRTGRAASSQLHSGRVVAATTRPRRPAYPLLQCPKASLTLQGLAPGALDGKAAGTRACEEGVCGDRVSSPVNQSLPSPQAIPAPTPPLLRSRAGAAAPALPKGAEPGGTSPAHRQLRRGAFPGTGGARSALRSPGRLRRTTGLEAPTPHFLAVGRPLEGQSLKELDLNSEPAFLRFGKDSNSNPASSPSCAVLDPKVRGTSRQAGSRKSRSAPCSLDWAAAEGSPVGKGEGVGAPGPLWALSRERLQEWRLTHSGSTGFPEPEATPVFPVPPLGAGSEPGARSVRGPRQLPKCPRDGAPGQGPAVAGPRTLG
ncbi:LOW QUALITY PROTEIN: striated muscle-specific serine/threonine-protein kinase-like [Lemur catta]|uniref:LOW QUALITY PROTEIN: striated muscle-specific serine/threonine-protein kinase-like n=1 Tax=Lemur catta TaxID=9447 RepID=UPI001E26AC09|nr:LOW QUALITY PROTEIN: striated muscle-specific serine/threonine-protein kinase-like [Lemur catta]